MTFEESVKYIESNFATIKEAYKSGDKEAVALGNMYDMATKFCGPAEQGILPCCVEAFIKTHKDGD